MRNAEIIIPLLFGCGVVVVYVAPGLRTRADELGEFMAKSGGPNPALSLRICILIALLALAACRIPHAGWIEVDILSFFLVLGSTIASMLAVATRKSRSLEKSRGLVCPIRNAKR